MKNNDLNNDLSHGYEKMAETFISRRGQSTIGVSTIASWSKSLPAGAAILDIGCGFGVPYAELLINKGFELYGIDASPTLIDEFHKRFPKANVKCEAVETSNLFERSFDGVMAIGILFLLSEQTQLTLIQKVARSLNPMGRFLFTAPYQKCEWTDILTGQISLSLGKDAYISALSGHGIFLLNESSDEGANHYYDCIKY